MTDLENVYLYSSIILAILLSISEILAWSKCKANALTQLVFCLNTVEPLVPVEVRPLVEAAESIASTLDSIQD